MELNKAKALFDEGVFKSATVTKFPMRKGYMLTMAGSHNRLVHLTGQRTGIEPREFSSIDAAINNAAKIGFTVITVDLS